MHLSGKHRTLLSLYGLGWSAAMPFLALSSRLRKGFWERTVQHEWGRSAGWQDVWLQAASAGEAFLALELVKELALDPMNLMTTTGTSQGMEILGRAQAWLSANKQANMRFRREFFPFDKPKYMRKALRVTLPKVVVLLETELWPGLLAACAEQDLPVVVVNGRMGSKSLAGYLTLSGFFRAVAPRKILAVSAADGRRFASLFGQDRVAVMPNMKFDRVALKEESLEDNPLVPLIGEGASFAVLGSIREPEENEVLAMVQGLKKARPRTTLGLFPRHMHRVGPWTTLLDKAGLPWVLRSQAVSPVPAGTIVLWDVFGELDAAYALCRAAFVGGSLKPLGGQNFLEPLAHGVSPCIGPHWTNFAWVGRDIVNQGLVFTAKDAAEATERMVKLLSRPMPKETVCERFQAYVASRRGGTVLAADQIRRVLDEQNGVRP